MGLITKAPAQVLLFTPIHTYIEFTIQNYIYVYYITTHIIKQNNMKRETYRFTGSGGLTQHPRSQHPQCNLYKAYMDISEVSMY